MVIANPIYKELNRFMTKFGLVDKSTYYKLASQFSKNQNEYDEQLAIESIKNYLTYCINDYNSLSTISNNIYEKYVDYDDEKVIRIIRKVFIIYTHSIKQIKLRYFLRFKLKSALPLKSNFIYTKKKSPSVMKEEEKSNIQNINKSMQMNNSKDNSMINQSQRIIEIKKNESFQIPKRKKMVSTPNTPRVHKRTISKEKQEELFTQLYNDSKTRKDKIRKLSLEKEKKFNSIYTFTPVIYTRQNNISTEGNFIERLSTYEKQKSKKMQQIKREIELNTPKPITSNKRIPITESHLIPIIKSYPQHKKEKIEKIKNEMLQEQGVTFKPVLNQSVNANIKENLIERNENFIKEKEAKLSYFSKCEDSECTFKPKINSDKLPVDNENKKVGERLYEYQSKYRQKIEEMKSQYKTSYSFKPKISKNTNEILLNKQKMIEEIKNRYSNNQSRLNEGDSNLIESTKKINEITEEDMNSIANYEHSTDNNIKEDKKEIVDIQSIGDDKLIEMAKNYLSVDESLDKFTFKFKNRLNMNNIHEKVSPVKKIESSNEIDSIKPKVIMSTSISSSKKKNVMNNLDYYDHLY